MKFISNKVCITAGALTDFFQVKPKESVPSRQMSLPMTKPPVPGATEQPKTQQTLQPYLPMTLPPGQTPFGPHNVKEHNIFNDLESPEAGKLGISTPFRTEATGDGIRSSRFHFDEKGNKTGVAKADTNSTLKEPLVHFIGEHIQPGLIPRTVIRTHKDENFGSGKMIPHSVQEFSPGAREHDLSPRELQEMQENPQHSAIRLFDYLIGNNDRHHNNMIYDATQ